MESPRKLRVVILNDLLPPDSEGGMELSALELGRGLQSLGHQVEWVCSQWRPAYEGIKGGDPRIHRILRRAEMPLQAGSWRSFRAAGRKINVAIENYRRLDNFLNGKSHFDVALVFGVLSIGLATVHAFSDNDIPIVWSVGDVAIPAHFGLPGKTRAYKLAFNTIGKVWHEKERKVDFSRVLFTSGFVQKQFEHIGIKPQLSAILPRAIDFELERGEKADPPLIVIACRLTKARGVHTAIEALSKLGDLSWKLQIIGGGDEPYLKELKKLAQPLGSRVSFAGKLPKEEVIRQMKRATIVINPTLESEGFGRANIEALACGALLVATDVPSIHDVLGGQNAAELYKPGDVEALAGCLKELLTIPDKFNNRIETGIELIQQNFQFHHVLQGLEKYLFEAAAAVENHD